PAVLVGPAVPRQAGLVQVASPSEPACATDLGAVRGPAARVPSPPASAVRAHLGSADVSRIAGRAGWWKSPCPDLVRAPAGQPAGATRQPIQRSFVPVFRRVIQGLEAGRAWPFRRRQSLPTPEAPSRGSIPSLLPQVAATDRQLLTYRSFPAETGFGTAF